MCCTYRVVEHMTAWGSCTLTRFDCQFLFLSGSLKNDYTHSCITYRLPNIFYTTMTQNIIDLYGRIHRQMPSYCLYTNTACIGICHVVKNVLRKPVLIGPLESDIVKVRYMSEKATENKVYCTSLLWIIEYIWPVINILDGIT